MGSNFCTVTPRAGSFDFMGLYMALGGDGETRQSHLRNEATETNPGVHLLSWHTIDPSPTPGAKYGSYKHHQQPLLDTARIIP